MGFFYSGAAWRFFLRLLGGTQVLAGVLALLATGLAGDLIPSGLASGLAMIVCGWILLSRRMSPGFLREPESLLSGFGALLAAVILSLIGPVAALLILSPLQSNASVLPILPLGILGLLNAIFILPLAAMGPSLNRDRRKQAAQGAAVRADPSLLTPAARAFGWSHWVAIRLVGIALLVPVLWLSHDFFTGGSVWQVFIFDGRKTGALMIAMPILAAMMVLPVPMSRSLAFHVPLEWKNILAQLFFAVPAIMAALYWFLPVYLLIMADPRAAIGAPLIQSVLEHRDAVVVGTGIVLGTLSVLAFVARPRGLPEATEVAEDGEPPLRPHAARSAASDMPEVQKKKKDLRAARLPEPKLPAMGGMMKLYVAADWLVLRLLGLGLLGTAYLLWQMMEAGRDLPQRALSYGFEPLHALIAYGVAGAFLAVPYLLPRNVVAPRHVLGGLVKAGLILGAGLVVRPVVPTAISLLVDEKYHPTLLYIAPHAMNVVIGLAVTGALFTSFFRQMGKTPKFDYLGNPVVEMTPDDLHRLRQARMGLH
ncbi:hypothetical protein [Jannaschia formosa]|uniref:hypothetical protein n=1 Tax=Jannaschia formosa TaxID=2259592 RepID=UPI000E1B925E|nr:hypothetical protein [Jannaschia formosa]TFL16732.1 hypothetical protein DR046_18310 [Jannaschia formosa]